MKIKNLQIMNLELEHTDGLYKSIQKAKFEANRSKVLFWCCGYDTLRLGLMRSGNWKSNNDYLGDVFGAVGATVHPIKWIVETGIGMKNEQCFATDPIVIELYEDTTGKVFEGVGYRYEKAFAVWLIDYKGAVTVVTQWTGGNYLHWELHGLSQPHHSKGAIKNELLWALLDRGLRLELLGYDIAFDAPMPFSTVIEDIVTPWCFVKALEGQSKERYGLYPYKTGTIYLQPSKWKRENNAVKIYDKSHKHELPYQLTRVEITKKFEAGHRPRVCADVLELLLTIERQSFLGTDALIVEVVMG